MENSSDTKRHELLGLLEKVVADIGSVAGRDVKYEEYETPSFYKLVAPERFATARVQPKMGAKGRVRVSTSEQWAESAHVIGTHDERKPNGWHDKPASCWHFYPGRDGYERRVQALARVCVAQNP